MTNTRYMVILSLFTAMAGTLHVIESLLPPPFPVPGAKLGLANVVSLFLLVTFGLKSSLYVTTARVILGSMFGGALLGPAFVMSMGGGVLSVLAMNIVFKRFTPPFSLYGVSILGAVVHNTAQVILAAFIVSSTGLLWYIPYLVFFAVPTGILTGALVIYLKARIPENLLR
jgi:heptaprenyl diphosphate synthase